MEVLIASVMSDYEIPWTVACQVPLFMEFSRQEYWSGLPLPLPGDWQGDSLPLVPHGKIKKSK